MINAAVAEGKIGAGSQAQALDGKPGSGSVVEAGDGKSLPIDQRIGQPD
jgi:hypothetical protein